MAYYNKCPECGANLDPGERCDCGICEEITVEIKKAPAKVEVSASATLKHQLEMSISVYMKNNEKSRGKRRKRC